MFGYIAGPDLDERIVWAVDDLAEVLNRSDMAAILHDFGKRTRQEDPVVHFYETFLAQYDPRLRELRGVYYTPEPVVSYIVRSVDQLLKRDFDLADGLADTTTLKATSSDGNYSLVTHKLQILDPATGTGTFLYYIINHIYESFKDNRGMWSSYVSQHLLPRLFGFELLMAPYAVAHLKLGLQLAETHMLAGQNVGITIGRAGQVIDQGEWNIVFCTNYITEYNLYRRGGNNLFPLYLYPDASKRTLFDTELPTDAPGGRSPNLAQTFTRDVAEHLQMEFISDGKGDLHKTFGPEDIFHYMYAIFYSPTYRSRYAQFLKIDFPRLPLTSNDNLFYELCALGDRLVRLHLMERFVEAKPNYPVDGNNTIEKIEYVEPRNQLELGRVYINKTQYFHGISPQVWEFHIGGYQVCEKWLKDRKGRRLSFNDIQHYQRIVAALAETNTLMDKIDETIEQYGGWPIE